MKKAWDTHKTCKRCRKTRTKNEYCASCTAAIRKEKNFLEDAKWLAQDVVKLKAKCGRLQFYRTLHLLEAVVTQIGWEIAERVK